MEWNPPMTNPTNDRVPKRVRRWLAAASVCSIGSLIIFVMITKGNEDSKGLIISAYVLVVLGLGCLVVPAYALLTADRRPK